MPDRSVYGHVDYGEPMDNGQLPPDKVIDWLGSVPGQQWTAWHITPVVHHYRDTRPGAFADVLPDHPESCPWCVAGIPPGDAYTTWSSTDLEHYWGPMWDPGSIPPGLGSPA